MNKLFSGILRLSSRELAARGERGTVLNFPDRAHPFLRTCRRGFSSRVARGGHEHQRGEPERATLWRGSREMLRVVHPVIFAPHKELHIRYTYVTVCKRHPRYQHFVTNARMQNLSLPCSESLTATANFSFGYSFLGLKYWYSHCLHVFWDRSLWTSRTMGNNVFSASLRFIIEGGMSDDNDDENFFGLVAWRGFS